MFLTLPPTQNKTAMTQQSTTMEAEGKHWGRGGGVGERFMVMNADIMNARQ